MEIKSVLKEKTNQQQSKSLAYYNQRIEELQVLNILYNRLKITQIKIL